MYTPYHQRFGVANASAKSSVAEAESSQHTHLFYHPASRTTPFVLCLHILLSRSLRIHFHPSDAVPQITCHLRLSLTTVSQESILSLRGSNSIHVIYNTILGIQETVLHLDRPLLKGLDFCDNIRLELPNRWLQEHPPFYVYSFQSSIFC